MFLQPDSFFWNQPNITDLFHLVNNLSYDSLKLYFPEGKVMGFVLHFQVRFVVPTGQKENGIPRKITPQMLML